MVKSLQKKNKLFQRNLVSGSNAQPEALGLSWTKLRFGGFWELSAAPSPWQKKPLKRGVLAHYSYFFFSDCLGVVAPTFDVDFNIYCTSLGRFANP